MRLDVLERTNSELEFKHKFCVFSMEIERVIVVSIWLGELPEI